jgi:hypothetical protein
MKKVGQERQFEGALVASSLSTLAHKRIRWRVSIAQLHQGYQSGHIQLGYMEWSLRAHRAVDEVIIIIDPRERRAERDDSNL